MQHAEEGADDEWHAFMLAAVREIASRQEYFASDDVERLRVERNGPATHEKRAFGPLIMNAKRAGICTPTTTFDRSTQVVAHRRPMRVWRSLIYQGETT